MFAFRSVCLLLFILCSVLFLISFFKHRNVDSGSVALAIYALDMVIVLSLSLNLSKASYVLMVILASFTAVVTFIAIAITLFMIIYTNLKKPNGDENATMLVLGCSVRNNNMSPCMKRRTDAAIEYLKAHKDVSVILSGGHSNSDTFRRSVTESRTEADIMYSYMETKGLDMSNVMKETLSGSTQQNIMYSRNIIDEKCLPRTVIIVTSDYHLCRACLFAERSGMHVHGIYAKTPLPMLMQCLVRELLGLIHMWLLGS